MNVKNTLVFGAVIWVIMFAVASAFAGYKVGDQLWAQIIIMLATAAVAYLFARPAAPHSAASALLFGVIWAALGLVLDYIISRKFAPGLYSQWPYWVSYALIVLAPLLAIKKQPGAAAATL